MPYKRAFLRAHRLDIYAPLAEVAPGEAPVVVFFHGGSWVAGDKITIRIIDRFLRRMREERYYVIAVNYTASLLRGIGGPVQNAYDALSWIVAHAPEYGYSPRKLGLYGVSAGGHVALMTASRMTREGYPCAFVFAECAPTDLITMRDGEAFESSVVFRVFPEQRLAELSPTTHVSEDLPPVLLFHGEADRTVHVNQSRTYAEGVEAVGGSTQLVVYPGGDHAFLNFPDEIWYEQKTRALEFFKAHFERTDDRDDAVHTAQ